jgi:hypothetical protein
MNNSKRASKIDALANLYPPVDKYKSKYKKPTIYALVLVLLLLGFLQTIICYLTRKQRIPLLSIKERKKKRFLLRRNDRESVLSFRTEPSEVEESNI